MANKVLWHLGTMMEINFLFGRGGWEDREIGYIKVKNNIDYKLIRNKCIQLKYIKAPMLLKCLNMSQ